MIPSIPDTPTFDLLRQSRADGSEFWSARDLMGPLGYDTWRRFDEAIHRAGFAALQSVAFFLAMVFLVSATVKGALLVAVILGAITLHWSPRVTPRRSLAVWTGAAALAVLVLVMPHVHLPGGDFRSITTAISYGAFWVSALLMAQVHPVEEVVHGAAR